MAVTYIPMVPTDEGQTEVDYVMAEELGLNDLTYGEDVWMIYGKANRHMTPYEKFFTTLDRTHKRKVGLVDGSVISVEGVGDVKVIMKGGEEKTISEVLFVPGLNRNVLSMSQMEIKGGCSFSEGEGGICIVRDRTGAEFGETTWDQRGGSVGLSLRMQVIEE